MGLLDIIQRKNRDFDVCSDCQYFRFTKYLYDPKLGLKEGYCALTEKTVDNKYEVNCEDFSNEQDCCSTCEFFIDCYDLTEEELKNLDIDPSIHEKYCTFHNKKLDKEHTTCEDFFTESL